MKARSLILVAVLAGCSPTQPSPMDVQVAIERYYLQDKVDPEANYSVVISCTPISEMTVYGSDGKLAHVRFRFEPGAGRSGTIYSVDVRNGGKGWYIPFETRLDRLPCEASKVREVQDSI